jgi:molybdate transport system permease protein
MATSVGTLPGSRRARRARHDSALFIVVAALFLLFVALPVVGLVVRWVSFTVGTATDAGSMVGSEIVESALLSLGTTAAAMAVIVLFGTPLAYLFARRDFPMKRTLNTLVELPVVMPPVVAGLALLAAFGRNGVAGPILAAIGINIAFTPVAVVLAQVFVAAPLYIRAAQGRFAAIPGELLRAAELDGAGSVQRFAHVVLPLSSHALVSGLAMAWARALGEFGATILVAGNLAGRTRTMPLLVYSALERDLGASFTVAVVLLLLAAATLLLVRRITHVDETADPLAEG